MSSNNFIFYLLSTAKKPLSQSPSDSDWLGSWCCRVLSGRTVDEDFLDMVDLKHGTPWGDRCVGNMYSP